jgi:hypothetical protein
VKRVVAVSGGKDSTCLALALAEREPGEFVYLITPTGNELPEMVAHWERLQTMLGQRFVALKPFTLGDGLEHLIRHWTALPNDRQRWCTRMLKIQPTVAWLKANAPCVQFVGLRADEEERRGIYGDMEGVTQRYPLREWGWGIADVEAYLIERGVTVPRRTDCAFCYGQRLGEWWRLWKDHPTLWTKGEELEALTGHTFRSASRDTWPASMAGLRAEFEAGRVPPGSRPKPGETRRLFSIYDDGAAGPCRVCSL